MPKQPNIKWRDRDTKKLENEIKKFNAKVYRSRKKYNNWGHLPRPITASDKREMLEALKSAPRNEFNKKVKSLGRFSGVKGSEEPIKSKTGNVVSAYEKKETSIKVATLNRKRKAEVARIKEIEATNVNKKLGTKRGEMEDGRISELKPIAYDFNKKQGGREWDSFQRMLDNNLAHDADEKKAELYKSNIIKGLRNAHGEAGEDIALLLEQIPSEAIVEKYYQEEQATIDWTYDEQKREMILGVMRRIWGSVADEHKIKLSEEFKEKREAFKTHS